MSGVKVEAASRLVHAVVLRGSEGALGSGAPTAEQAFKQAKYKCRGYGAPTVESQRKSIQGRASKMPGLFG